MRSLEHPLLDSQLMKEKESLALWTSVTGLSDPEGPQKDPPCPQVLPHILPQGQGQLLLAFVGQGGSGLFLLRTL